MSSKPLRDYISWSEISTWLNCQLQWRFKYVDNMPRGVSTIDQQMGSAVHAILATHYGAAPEERSQVALHDAALKAYQGLILDNDSHRDLRLDQLVNYAVTIWKTWGRDLEMPKMVTETPVRVPLPWNPDKAYLCIPDAYYVNKAKNWGIIMSHKTRLSSLPDMGNLVKFHQQAPLEAWALCEAYGLKEVLIYINGLTPTKAEREGPILFTQLESDKVEAALTDFTRAVGRDPITYRSGPHCYTCEYRALHEALVEPGADIDAVKASFRKE